jgi:HTH-type transcriptional regulator / antitoxin MqsA
VSDVHGKVCPACGASALKLSQFTIDVEHKGKKGQIAQCKWKCGHCNSDLFDDALGKQNRRAWVRFQNEVEGVPTGPQIRAMRRALRLSSEEAGALLGGGPKAFSKYENEEIVPTGAMRKLLNYFVRKPHRFQEFLEANGMEPAGGTKPVSILGEQSGLTGDFTNSMLTPHFDAAHGVAWSWAGNSPAIYAVVVKSSKTDSAIAAAMSQSFDAVVAKAGAIYSTSPVATAHAASEDVVMDWPLHSTRRRRAHA